MFEFVRGFSRSRNIADQRVIDGAALGDLYRLVESRHLEDGDVEHVQRADLVGTVAGLGDRGDFVSGLDCRDIR